MISKTDSTTDDDCRFESPWLATALTRSFFVTVGSHLPLGTRRGEPTRPRRSLPASRDEGRIALLLELAEGRRRGRLVVERTDADAIQGPVTRRGGWGARRSRRGCRSAGGAPDLNLEPVHREILRERHGITQRQARLHNHAAGRRLGAEPFAAELRIDVRGRATGHVDVIAVARRSRGRRRARRRGPGGLRAARRRLFHGVLLFPQTVREPLGRVGILERADLDEISGPRSAGARRWRS